MCVYGLHLTEEKTRHWEVKTCPLSQPVDAARAPSRTHSSSPLSGEVNTARGAITKVKRTSLVPLPQSPLDWDQGAVVGALSKENNDALLLEAKQAPVPWGLHSTLDDQKRPTEGQSTQVTQWGEGLPFSLLAQSAPAVLFLLFFC